MADYPAGIYNPRAKENKPSVVYAPTKKTVQFAEDIVGLDDEVVAIETELGANPRGGSADVAVRLADIEASIPAKATGAEINTGTDDAKFATPKAIADSNIAFLGDIPSVPVKATGAEINTGTDDAKFATPKAIADSDIAFLGDIPAPFDLFAKFFHAINWESLDGFVPTLSAGSTVLPQCGAVKFTTGGTSGFYAFIRQNDAGGYYNPFNAGKPVTVEWVLKTGVAVTTRTVLLHFAYTNVSPPNPAFPHMGFKIVNGDIFASSAGMAGEKLDDTGVNENPAAIEQVRLKVVFDPGVSLKFYVNDVLKITRLTDLPANGNVNYMFNEGVTTNAAAVRYLYLGRHLIQIPY